MPQAQFSIFDPATSAIEVKRSTIRRKAMIFTVEKAHEVIQKINIEIAANPKEESNKISKKQKYAA